MTTITDSIDINTKPNNIFNWFNSIQENYKEWHPDHVLARWARGETFEVGSILYIEEYIHGDLHKLQFKITEMVENQLIKYKTKFPMSLICPRGAFIVHPMNGGCKFTAELEFRFGWLIQKIARKRFLAFQKHMEEEGKNLKMILERNENRSGK